MINYLLVFFLKDKYIDVRPIYSAPLFFKGCPTTVGPKGCPIG